MEQAVWFGRICPEEGVSKVVKISAKDNTLLEYNIFDGMGWQSPTHEEMVLIDRVASVEYFSYLHRKQNEELENE